MELVHFSHQNPLILCDERNDGGAKKVPCEGCLLPVSGATYNCTECKFILHKSCAELPNKIIHFLHAKHPLTLIAKSPLPPVCNNCNERIWGFDYHCSLCQFDLCIQCVLLQQIVEHEGHEHSFKLLKPMSFRCDACGKIDCDMSCICSTCHLCVHKTCASLPPIIKHVDHYHPLSLIHSVQLKDSMDNLCKVCGNNVDTCYWYYYCAGCTYIAHLDCATSETKLGDERSDPGSAFVSVPNECTIGLTSKDANEISLTKIDRVTELQHVSHQHLLTLSDDEPDSEEICDGCMQTISAPFYKCAQCNFFLHVSCAELPYNIQHRLHPHSLHLFGIKTWIFHIFRCNACHEYFNGFAYGCNYCEFRIDVRCSSVSGTLRHEAHEHTLSLDKKESKSKCNACGRSCSTKFRCEACDFNIDLRCAALPSSVTHKWDKHPLKLTFSMIEDKSDKYDCDFCEEQGDSNHWFYYCKDCDVSVHPLCLLGKHMRIKFGKSVQLSTHPHLVTSVKKSRQCLPSCHSFYRDDTVVFECADCDFHFHAGDYKN